MTVVSYDIFTEAFLDKIKEYEFLNLLEYNRDKMIDGFMKRALSEFKKNRKYDFIKTKNDEERVFDFSEQPVAIQDGLDNDIDELVDIVSDGMVCQWLKSYKNNQELLENILNTRDFTSYSPAELLKQVRGTYNEAHKEFIQKIREYSYNHMDLGDLHS